MEFIYNEQLVWVVDGVNKVFTSVKEIESIEDMRLWGADYTDFSFIWNVVTLTDAPTVWTGIPKIDYFIKSTIVTPTWTSTTFAKIVEDIFEEIWQSPSSYQYPRTMIDRLTKEELTKRLNESPDRVKKLWTYSFNKASDCRVTEYSATSLNVGTIPTYTPSNWKVILWYWEVIDYSNVSSTSFLSLSWLWIVYKGWDEVTIGYKIPTWVKKISEVIINWRLINYVDMREYISSLNWVYTIIDWYLFLPKTYWETVVNVTYIKSNSLPITWSDIIDFNEDYMAVIRFWVQVKAFVMRWDERLSTMNQLLQDELKKYKSYNARQVEWIRNVIQANWFNRVAPRFNGNRLR